jgi:hypothetical protein
MVKPENGEEVKVTFICMAVGTDIKVYLSKVVGHESVQISECFTVEAA